MFSRIENHGVRINRGTGNICIYFSLTYPQVLIELNHLKPSVLKNNLFLISLFLRPTENNAVPYLLIQSLHFVERHKVLSLLKIPGTVQQSLVQGIDFCILIILMVLTFHKQAL